jgi:hypothetical protein
MGVYTIRRCGKLPIRFAESTPAQSATNSARARDAHLEEIENPLPGLEVGGRAEMRVRAGSGPLFDELLVADEGVVKSSGRVVRRERLSRTNPIGSSPATERENL